MAGEAEFDEIVGILGDVLSEAWNELDKRRDGTGIAAGAPEAPIGPTT